MATTSTTFVLTCSASKSPPHTAHQATCKLSRRCALTSLAAVALTWNVKRPLAATCPTEPEQPASIDPAELATDAVTERVELWIRAGPAKARRVELELYGCVTPRTVSNFVDLVVRGDYDNTAIYRIVPQLTVQMGDVLKNGGSSGRSASADGLPLQPENYIIRHTCPGVVSMTKNRDGRIDSRFFVATRPGDSAYLDDKYVAFGKVTANTLSVLTDLDRLVGPANAPRVPVIIERASLVKE